MKKVLLVAALIVSTVGAWGQAQVNFNNRVPAASINAPIFGSDGVTPAPFGSLWVQLYGGPGGAAEGSLTAIGSAIKIGIGTSTGGYFSGGGVTIPPADINASGVSALQVRAWDVNSADYATAVGAGALNGKSGILQITPGVAPSPPANLTGLASFSVSSAVVPEPSSILLGLLGAATMLVCRRK